MTSKRPALLGALESLRSDQGAIEEIKDFNDNKLIVIIHDGPFINVSISKVIYNILDIFIRQRLINLVGCDGAFGNVDTGWLKKIKYYTLQKQITDSLFETGKLTAAEYLHIVSLTPFVLFGPDDKKLYDQSMELWIKLTPLWKFINENRTPAQVQKVYESPTLGPLVKDFNKFDELDHKRADLILNNVLNKMAELKHDSSALVCKGNLPQYISEKATRESISYVIINPTKLSNDDIKAYQKTLEDQAKIFNK